MKEIIFRNILEVEEKYQKLVRIWRNKKEVNKYMLCQHYITKREHLSWLTKLKTKNDKKFWVVFINKHPAGAIYSNNINKKKLSSYVGLYFGNSRYRGKGFGKKILFKLINIFFTDMGFNVLYARILSNNERSIHIFKKFGFKKTRRKKYRNSIEIINFKLDRKNWQNNKKAIKNECI